MSSPRLLIGALIVGLVAANCEAGRPTRSSSSAVGESSVAICPGHSTAHDVVNSFWFELDRYYAVFDSRLPSGTWDAVGHQACAAVSSTMSDDELFDLIVSMARALDDGHIQVTAPDLGRRATGWVTGYEAGETMSTLEHNVEQSYLDGQLRRACNDLFAWGRIGSVGYLNLTSFEELSETGDERHDTACASAAMAQVSRDLNDIDGMIVDIRNNEGGWDDVGLEVARWFAGPRALTYSKVKRDGATHDSFGASEDVYVEASPPDGLDAPTVVLTSGWTFSAAETFALSMSVRVNVTLLGERTSGHFSDLEHATLPNGWSYTYSSERYLAADGNIYEARGVPAGVPIDFDDAAFASGRDTMLEAALQLLGKPLVDTPAAARPPNVDIAALAARLVHAYHAGDVEALRPHLAPDLVFRHPGSRQRLDLDGFLDLVTRMGSGESDRELEITWVGSTTHLADSRGTRRWYDIENGLQRELWFSIELEFETTGEEPMVVAWLDDSRRRGMWKPAKGDGRMDTEHFAIVYFTAELSSQEATALGETLEHWYEETRRYLGHSFAAGYRLHINVAGGHDSPFASDPGPQAFILVPTQSAKRTYGFSLVHELTHNLIGLSWLSRHERERDGVELFSGNRLFDEGFAVFVEEELTGEGPRVFPNFGLETHAAYWQALQKHDEPIRPVLEAEILRQAADQRLGYLTQASFCKHLVQTYGLDRFLRLFAADPSAAKEIYGRDLNELEREWRRFLEERFETEDMKRHPAVPIAMLPRMTMLAISSRSVIFSDRKATPPAAASTGTESCTRAARVAERSRRAAYQIA